MTHGSRARCLAGFFFLAALLLGGCANLAPQTFALRDNPPSDLVPRADLRHVPFFPQDDYYCGPAALAMALNAVGVRASTEALIDQVYLPGRKGSLQVEMLAAARRNGMVAYVLEPELTHALREIAAGTPVVAFENHGVRWYPLWHYSVLVGYDLERREVIQHSGRDARKTIPLGLFEFLWKTEGRWAMIVMPPDRLPATASERRYAEAVVALERIGQARSAHTAYQAMLKRWPSSLPALMGSGNTAHALGDLEAAEAAFRQATIAHPDSVAAHNNLAQTLLDRGKLDAALAAAERAVSLGGPLASTALSTLEGIRSRQRALNEEK
jgi:tetratricopeptide (TPR) repeat protein